MPLEQRAHTPLLVRLWVANLDSTCHDRVLEDLILIAILDDHLDFTALQDFPALIKRDGYSVFESSFGALRSGYDES